MSNFHFDTLVAMSYARDKL